MEKLQSWFREEMEKINKLPSWKSKLTYIWQYYYLWIIGVVAFVCFAIYGSILYNNAIREYYLYITFANTTAEIGTGSELYQEFCDSRQYDLSKKNVEFNNAAYFDYGKNETGNSYFETFIMYTDAGTLDAVTMEKESLILLGQSGRLLDLNSKECKAFKEKYESRFVYAKPFDEEYSKDLVPIGIDISDSTLMKKYHIYPQSCVIGIGAYSHNLKEVEAFLSFVLEE